MEDTGRVCLVFISWKTTSIGIKMQNGKQSKQYFFNGRNLLYLRELLQDSRHQATKLTLNKFLKRIERSSTLNIDNINTKIYYKYLFPSKSNRTKI